MNVIRGKRSEVIPFDDTISPLIKDELEKYIDEMVEQGYMLEDGSPLKCSCGCADLEQTDKYYEECGLVEFQMKCKSCGEKVGLWAYGSWQL